MKKESEDFQGVIGRTIKDSTDWWPPQKVAQGSPNVVMIVLDDVGYAQLGCYGSDISTPNIDKLANNGVKYTDFHTTALCSPTRACLLTGRNHHTVGMGMITEFATGFPGYNGRIPKSAAFMSEILRQNGYNSFAIGKWHLAPANETTAAGPYDRWPLGQGFERYYGFLGGETNQYYPDLVFDNHTIDPPATPEDGYHLTNDLTDKAIQFIKDQKSVNPDKPFFLYFAPGACHAPHQAPRDFIDKYRGHFDQGWDKWRLEILEQQKKMGVVPPNTELSPRPPWVQAWETLTADEKKVFSRMMEVYAGFLEHTDYNIGRLLEYFKDNNLLDNTIIFLVSDNGASAEGGATGSINENLFFNGLPSSMEENLKALDDLGSPKTYNHYPWGWALAGNSPLKRWKREVHQGGISDPLIIHWPNGIEEKGAIRDQYHHAIDIYPTILELLQLDAPEEVNGFTQKPIEGTSLAYSLNAPDAPTRKRSQYYEMIGSRAIWQDGWKAVTFHRPDKDDDFDNDHWELYKVSEDFSESHDLAAEEPEKLKELIDLWWAEAGKHNVLPLDDRMIKRIPLDRPQASKEKSSYTLFAGAAPINETAAVNTHNRSYAIDADVDIPETGAEGVVVAQGSKFGGFSLFVQDNRLKYVHNYVGLEEYEVSSATEIPTGHNHLRLEFRKDGPNQGNASLFINEQKVGEGRIPKTCPNAYGLAGGGLAVGRNVGAEVSKDYKPPFNFTGKLEKVVIDVDGDVEADAQAEFDQAMRRQ